MIWVIEYSPPDEEFTDATPLYFHGGKWVADAQTAIHFMDRRSAETMKNSLPQMPGRPSDHIQAVPLRHMGDVNRLDLLMDGLTAVDNAILTLESKRFKQDSGDETKRVDAVTNLWRWRCAVRKEFGLKPDHTPVYEFASDFPKRPEPVATDVGTISIPGRYAPAWIEPKRFKEGEALTAAMIRTVLADAPKQASSVVLHHSFFTRLAQCALSFLNGKPGSYRLSLDQYHETLARYMAARAGEIMATPLLRVELEKCRTSGLSAGMYASAHWRDWLPQAERYHAMLEGELVKMPTISVNKVSEIGTRRDEDEFSHPVDYVVAWIRNTHPEIEIDLASVNRMRAICDAYVERRGT